MQKFKVADGAAADGTALDRDGFTAGTRLLAKWINDNQWNVFDVVEGAGYALIDGDISQLAKAVRAPYNSNYTYNTSAIATQTVSDVVRGSDGAYYEVLDDGVTNDDPVTNLNGNWKKLPFKVADAVNADEALNKGQGDILYKGVDGYRGALDTIDLNTAFKAQTFYASSNALNLPTAYGGYIEISGNSYNRASQTFISQDGNIYFRKSDDGSTWSVWRQLAIQDDFVSLKATNGYQRLANGVIIQWGTIYANTSADTGETFTFPIAFPNACFVVTGSPEDNNGGAEGNDVWRNLTTTNFVLENWTGVATNFRYMAIGY